VADPDWRTDVPEPTVSPKPEIVTAPNALWARLRVAAVRPSTQEVHISLPDLPGHLHVEAKLVHLN
jgi:hypothetical protein